MNLEDFKKLSVKRRTEEFERRSILRFLDCHTERCTVYDIRFGSAEKREPDIIVRMDDIWEWGKIKTVGVEITEAFKNKEQARSKRDPKYKDSGANLDSSRGELVQKLRERVISKFEKSYDKSGLDELCLLVVNETDRKTSLSLDPKFKLFNDGTPVGELTAMQRVGHGLLSKNRAKFDNAVVLTTKENGGNLLLGVNLTWPGNSFHK